MSESEEVKGDSRRVSRILKLKDAYDSESEDDTEEDFFDREKIKTKFLSAWNNVKYGKVSII